MGEISIDASDSLHDFVLPAQKREFTAPDHAGLESSRSASSSPLRVIGPGRFERGYLERLSGLSAEIEVTRDRERRLLDNLREGKAALEVSQRVERGCQRRIDRLEGWLEARTQALLESERQQKRLAFALGSMQRELDTLREKAAPALRGANGQAQLAAGSSPKRRASLWQRMFGGGR
ncbi:MAG: hypothetical protein ABIP42_06715 [Planctomycetota bacterium]